MEEAKASDSAKTKKAYEEVADDEGIQPEFLTKFTGSYERILRIQIRDGNEFPHYKESKKLAEGKREQLFSLSPSSRPTYIHCLLHWLVKARAFVLISYCAIKL